MYVRIDNSRRNRVPLTPPANYAGITFSRDQPRKADTDQDTKIHKAHASPIADVPTTFKAIEPEITDESLRDDIPDADDIPIQEVKEEEKVPEKPKDTEDKPTDTEKECGKGILSDVLGGKFSLEDILLFASLFLLVSGQIDDEILLLAGILLLLSNP